MANEAHDPWALLREARDFMRQAAVNRGPCPDCTECDHRDAIIAEADAALAAHDAVPPNEEKVEWCAVGDTWATAYPVDGVEMTVMRWVDGPWKWWTKLETSAHGTASTEADAKSAAIAAARGLK